MANLLGRADASLVKAATDAAMANVPVDVSRIHERMMKSHERTMKSIGQSWVQGITGAMQIGQKLVAQAKRYNGSKDLKDSYNHKLKKRVIGDDAENLEKGEYKLEFDDKKITDFNDKKDVLNVQKEKEFDNFIKNAVGSELNTTRDNWRGFSGQKQIDKLDDKIAKRTTKLEGKDWATRIYTDFEGGQEIIEPRTVDGQLKKIRNDILAIRRDKDDPNRKDKIDKLRIKKDNLKSSVVNFRAQLQVVTEQLKLDNIDMMASSQGADGSLRMQFTRALLAEGKPLGEDAGEYAGARAQSGFNEEGKMTFMFVNEYGEPIENSDGIDMSIQIDDVQDLIIPKSPAIIEGFSSVTAASTNYNRGLKGLAYNPSQTNNFIDKTVIDKNSALNAINHSDGDMTSSLVSALNGVKMDGDGNTVTGSTEMSDFFWEQLGGLGSEWDTGDDGITVADFVGDDVAKKNFENLRDEVLKGKDINLIKQLLKANTNDQNEKHNALGLKKYKAAQNISSSKTPLSEAANLKIQEEKELADRVRADMYKGFSTLGDMGGRNVQRKGNKWIFKNGGTITNSISIGTENETQLIMDHIVGGGSGKYKADRTKFVLGYNKWNPNN